MKRSESPDDQGAARAGDVASAPPAKKRARLADSDMDLKMPAEMAPRGAQEEAKLLSQEEGNDPADMKLPPSDQPPQSPSHHASDPSTQTFPQRLMEMLDDQVVPDAMWWAEEGKAFAMDLSKFGDVLHQHFQATKYASFTRKLNKWGFRKLNNIDPDLPDSVVLYRHDLFQKGQPELLKSMSTKRKKKDKKTKKKKGADEQDDSERAKDTSISEETEEVGEQAEERVEVERDVGIQEEKGYSSADSLPQGLPRHLRPFQEGDGRPEGASDFVRHQMQQQLSFASSLAAHRITHPSTGGSETSGLTSADLPGLSSAGLQRGQSIALRDTDNRQLLESLISQETEQQQQQQRRMELALLRQQQENLANEMLVQRRLAASAASPARLPLPSSTLTLQGSLSALQDPALQGIHRLTSGIPGATRTAPSRSHSLNDLPSALSLPTQGNLSDLAARLRMQQSQSQAVELATSLNLQSQNLSELRGALEARSQTDISTALQLMSNQPRRTSETLSALELLSRSSQASIPPALHQSRSFSDIPSLLQMQAQLEQQQEQERQLAQAASAVAGAAASNTASLTSSQNNPTPSEQQLLEVLLERQRLQTELMEEQRRRQQRR